MARREPINGAIAAGLAAGVKVVPIAAIPALASFTSRKVLFVIIAIVTFLAPALPFLVSGPFMPGLGEYARRWEFNAPIYSATRWLVDTSGIDDASKSLFTSIKDSAGAEAVAPFVYAQLHPERMARAICGLLFLGGLLAAMRCARIESRVAWSIAALLLASPALHPWYWIVMLPLALEARSRLLVAFALASPASYLLYTAIPSGTTLAYAATYLLPLVTALLISGTIGRSRTESPDADSTSV